MSELVFDEMRRLSQDEARAILVTVARRHALGPKRTAMEPKAKEGQSLEIDAVASFE